MQVPPPIPLVAALPPRIKFGAFMICSRCQLAEEWCGCGKQPPPPPTPNDGADTSLIERIRTLKGGPS